MINHRKYLIWVSLYIIPTVLVLYFSCKTLSSKGHTTEGLVKLVFDLNLFHRGLPVSIPQSIPDSIPHSLPDTASQIGSKVSNIGNLVPSQLNSAIASAQTLISQGLESIPKGYSIGTKSACIIYDPRTECEDLPIKSTSSFQKITAVLPPLKPLNDFLSNTPSLEVILIVGLVFNIASTLTYTLVNKFPKLRFISAGLSLLSLVLLIMYIIFALMIFDFATKLGQSGTMNRGEIYCGAVGSVMHTLIAIGSIFVKFTPVRTAASP